ncbi:MAG: glucose-6-phosphate isomerase family protein [Candidatus Methanomethylicaceae archaeon]
MISIKQNFGDINVNEDLSISINGVDLHGTRRTLGDVFPLLYDPKSVEEVPKSTILYSMYRNFSLKEHVELFMRGKIRFDITVMANMTLGVEWNKTLGHYHPLAEDSLSYPELYQVLHGKATYLLQKKDGDNIVDFLVAEVREGEAILIPPGYGHVTVNTGKTVLVMVNLVSDLFQSIYDDYIEKRGAAYYLLTDGSLKPNPNYKKITIPRVSTRRFPVSKDLYTDFTCCPSCFNFLNKPSLLEDLALL